MRDTLAEEKTAARRAREQLDDILTDALCERYRQLTGKQASDKMRDDIWQAIHYDC